MSLGVNAFGTLLKIGDAASPEVFTTVSEVKDIEGPGLEQSFVELTHHTSPDRYREWVKALKDGQTVEFTLNWIPSNATHDFTSGLGKDFEDGTKRNFQLVFPTSPAATFAFAAFVQSLSPAAPVEGALELSVTLRVTGKPTLS